MNSGDPLSWREVQVLRLAALGRTDAQIARELGLSPNTVKSHLHRIYVKLRADGRAHAVALGYHRRILLVPGARAGRERDETPVVEQVLLVKTWAACGKARGVREAAGISRAQVAADCDAGVSTVTYWESGARTPKGAQLAAYHRALLAMAAMSGEWVAA